MWSLKLKKVVKPWRLSAFSWKKLSIVDDLVFKILYVLEAIVLVSTLCFFFLCCGCHI
ncbi:hypothetical protein PVL29_015036 [Vitis rotundifolia]|uniref:Transmembrane protein n=1 Tax=Vitis rotundifolia TaxID=103349 RepID=A0AA39DL30_VITRO|nr:hypothetical protein PVL29_015036 [Vitis rotundifolia]